MITRSQFLAATNSNNDFADKWLNDFNEVFDRYDMTTIKQQSMFISQIMHESNGLKSLIESFNYSVQGLAVFGSRLTEQQRLQLGRRVGEKVVPLNRQIQIASIVYSNRMGNGSIETQDGWNYRGRGSIMITGKNNYEALSESFGVDFIGNPNLLTEPEYALLSAGWFFDTNNLIDDSLTIEQVTKRINGGYNGLVDRKSRFEIAFSSLS